MNVVFTDHTGETPEERAVRKEIIDKLLPEETLVSSILEKSIQEKLFGTLTKMLKAELEIYKQYPKKAIPDKETAKGMVGDFDPRHPSTCFMGKAFKNNGNITDSELYAYRKRIGTIPHPTWGDCTILEIWGGDHIKEYPEMVIGAFKYGAGLLKECPTLKFHVNPLFQNKKSGEFKLTDKDIEEKEYHELLMAKALFYGVNEPKKRGKRR